MGEQAWVLINQWRREYNQIQLHSKNLSTAFAKVKKFSRVLKGIELQKKGY